MWQHNARNNEEPLAAIMLRCRRVQSSRCFTAAMYYWKLYQCSAAVSANPPSREPTLSRPNYFPLFPLHFSYCLTSTALFFGQSERVAFTVFANEVYCSRRWGFHLWSGQATCGRCEMKRTVVSALAREETTEVADECFTEIWNQ